jgi:tetratricopeptide (TPR) repeat protein
VRPKRPIDRQLAYAESFWICQYIEETWGHEAILKMLEEFRQGKEQRDVFPQILGKSLTEFQSDFFAWTERQVAGWGYDEETTKKVNDLKKKGEELIKSHDYKEAAKLWEEIITLRPVDALPHARLAGLYLSKDLNQPEKAVEHLIALHKVELNDDRYAKKIARVYRDMGKMEEAVKYGTQAVYMDPYDADAHDLLSQIYEKTGDQDKADREKHVMAVLEEWKKTVDQKKAPAPR